LNNAALMAICGLFAPSLTARAHVRWIIANALAGEFGLLRFEPGLGWYVGLSNVLHRLLTAGSWRALGERERFGGFILITIKSQARLGAGGRANTRQRDQRGRCRHRECASIWRASRRDQRARKRIGASFHPPRSACADKGAQQPRRGADLQQTVHGPTTTAVGGRAADGALDLSVYVPLAPR
jgi:hypothetical protein